MYKASAISELNDGSIDGETFQQSQCTSCMNQAGTWAANTVTCPHMAPWRAR